MDWAATATQLDKHTDAKKIGQCGCLPWIDVSTCSVKGRIPSWQAIVQAGGDDFGPSTWKSTDGKYRDVLEWPDSQSVAIAFIFDKGTSATITQELLKSKVGKLRKFTADVTILGFMYMFDEYVCKVGASDVLTAMDSDKQAAKRLFIETLKQVPMDWYRFNNTMDVERQIVTKHWQLIENVKDAEHKMAPDVWELASLFHFYRTQQQQLHPEITETAAIIEKIEDYLLQNMNFSRTSEYKVKKGSAIVPNMLLIYDRVMAAGCASELRESKAHFPKDSVFWQPSKFLLVCRNAGTSAEKLRFMVHLLWVRLKRGSLAADCPKLPLSKTHLPVISTIFDLCTYGKEKFVYPPDSRESGIITPLFTEPMKWNSLFPKNNSTQ